MKGRAITEAQKRQIIERLYAVWCKCPQLRLGQMIECYPRSRMMGVPDLFDVEDNPLLEWLEARFK